MYYFIFNGKVLGPFDEAKAIELVRQGRVKWDHEMSKDGTTWSLAKDCEKLFPRQPAPALLRRSRNRHRLYLIIHYRCQDNSLPLLPGRHRFDSGFGITWKISNPQDHYRNRKSFL